MSTYIQMFFIEGDGSRVVLSRHRTESVDITYDVLTVRVSKNNSSEEVSLFFDDKTFARLKEALTDERQDNTVEADTGTQPV